MINPIDLRIGNWVNIPKKGFTQITAGKDLEKLVKQGALPIPITVEIIKALGFIQRASSTLYEIKVNNFAYQVDAHRVMICHPGNMYCHWLGTHINYVHQIQNLFYCIIGHDLTLDLNAITP